MENSNFFRYYKNSIKNSIKIIFIFSCLNYNYYYFWTNYNNLISPQRYCFYITFWYFIYYCCFWYFKTIISVFYICNFNIKQFLFVWFIFFKIFQNLFFGICIISCSWNFLCLPHKNYINIKIHYFLFSNIIFVCILYQIFFSLRVLPMSMILLSLLE